MSGKASKLGESSSFTRAGTARSARRQLIDATLGGGDPTELPVQALSHNPDNPRASVGDVSGMADSLRTVGLVQPLTVASVDAYRRSHPDRVGELEPGAEYVVVDGHRRLAGAREAGLPTVKVMVDDTRVSSDEALLESSYVANAQREDLTELEQAQALESLVKFYGSQHKAATRLGISQALISQRLSLLRLDPELQADLQAGRRQVKHVRGLAKLDAKQQKQVADSRAIESKDDRKADAKADSPGGGDPSSDDSRTSSEASSAGSVPRQTAASSDAGTSSSGGRRDYASIDELDLPWDDPEWFADVLRRRMSATDRATLGSLLLATEDGLLEGQR